MSKLRGVDLFCGVGGFALGMQQAGIQIVRSMDFNPEALKVHRANIKEVRAIGLRRVVPPGYPTEPIPVPVDGKFQRGQIHKSRVVPHVADLTAVIDIAAEIAIDRPDIIFGGPPCQAFASSGQKKRDDDERSKLTEAFAILVAAARPKYFVMENVRGLRTSQTFERARAIFKAAGYGLTEEIVVASYYGVAQARERMIVAGCTDEADGWFSGYLHQYRTAQPKTVADLFGDDFGTPLRDFTLSADFDDYLDPETGQPPKNLWFRERDQKRLSSPDVDDSTRFYHASPGGKGSARVQRAKTPGSTLIRTTMHKLPSTYRPLEGDPVDLRNLYQPTFREFSLIGGFPEDWQWPEPIPKGERRTEEEMMAGEREGFLMLANAVPPPLAHAIGRAIIDHQQRRVPAISVEAADPRRMHWVHAQNKRTKNFRKLQRYRQWLAVGKGKQSTAVTQAISDLRKAKLLLSRHGLSSAKEELVAFDKLAATPKMIGSRRSQLRRALRDLAEFENYQSYIEAELFADDDEAYARDFLDYYGPNAGQFEEAEQPAPPPDFMRRREQDRPPQP